MKKLIITLAIALAACTAAFAQKGLSVGAGYQSYKWSVTTPKLIGDGTNTTNHDFGGFYAGASYTVLTVGPGINITPGLYFSMASYKDSDYPDDIQAKQSFIGVPINFSYKLDLVPGTLAIEPYVGPTFSFGLKYTSTIDGWDHTTNNYADDYDTSKFNVALGGGIALDIVDMIRVNVGYNYYLLNVYNGDNGDVKYQRNGVLNFGVAYLF